MIPGASHARDVGRGADWDDISLTGTGRKLQAFMREHKVASGDSILFTIEQYSPARWRVEHEPKAQRDQAAIDRSNHELMEALFAMLELASRNRSTCLHRCTAHTCK